MSEALVEVIEPAGPVAVPDPLPVMVQAERPQLVLVKDSAPPAAPVLVDGRLPPTVVEPRARPAVAFVGFSGPRGPAGPKGDPGGTGVLARPVGAVVQGLRIVRALNGVIFPVDLADESHAGQVIGLALQSVTVIGTDVNLQLAGPVTDSSWNWAPGAVWCGTDGALTQAPPADGWLLQVGRVISADTIDLDLSFPIFRG